jgi:hypothetical protein
MSDQLHKPCHAFLPLEFAGLMPGAAVCRRIPVSRLKRCLACALPEIRCRD